MSYKKYLLLFVFFSIAFIAGCREKGSEKKEERPKVTVKAELLGYSLFEAEKDCKIIGFNDLKECAENKLELTVEKMAARSAKRALKSESEYKYVCYGNYDIKYCDDLLDRAYLIAKRTPAEKEHVEAIEKSNIEN